MNRKVLGLAVGLLFVAMLVAPVLAIGPTNPEKNKNTFGEDNQVFMFNPGGVLQEWNDVGVLKYRLMRHNASNVNKGNAVDASLWPFPVNQTGTTFVMLLTAETRWVYVDQTGMYNLLRGFGFPVPAAAFISSEHPDGAYYKVDIVGKVAS